MSETKIGTITTLSHKGYGFIRPEEPEEKDIYFHATGLVDVNFKDLEAGMRVCYVEQEGRKGPLAADIVIDYFGYANKELDIKVKKDLRQKIK